MTKLMTLYLDHKGSIFRKTEHARFGVSSCPTIYDSISGLFSIFDLPSRKIEFQGEMLLQMPSRINSNPEVFPYSFREIRNHLHLFDKPYSLNHINQEDQNEKSVDKIMAAMDKMFDTSFATWLRNENNSEYIAICCKKFVMEYDIKRVIEALEWMTEGWNISALGQLLIGLFDENPGFCAPQFAAIVRCLGEKMSKEAFIEFTAMLLVGETVNCIAEFLVNLSFGWSSSDFVEFVGRLCVRLKYSNEFLKHLCVAFCKVLESRVQTKYHFRMIESIYAARFMRELQQTHPADSLSFSKFPSEFVKLISIEVDDLDFFLILLELFMIQKK